MENSSRLKLLKLHYFGRKVPVFQRRRRFTAEPRVAAERRTLGGWSNRVAGSPLPGPSPLRTVHETFTSHGSSPPKAFLCREAPGDRIKSRSP